MKAENIKENGIKYDMNRSSFLNRGSTRKLNLSATYEFPHLLIYRRIFVLSQMLIMYVDLRSNKVTKTFLAWTSKSCILTLSLCLKGFVAWRKNRPHILCSNTFLFYFTIKTTLEFHSLPCTRKCKETSFPVHKNYLIKCYWQYAL